MSKRIALLILILGTMAFNASATLSSLDSLKNVIVQTKEDTNKVNSLIALSKKFFDSSPESAINYAREAKDLAVKLDYPHGQALALKTIGIVYYNQAKYADAVNYWTQAQGIFNSIHDEAGVANIFSNLGAVYFDAGDEVKALEYYFEGLHIAEQITDTFRIITLLGNIGAVYLGKDNSLDHALEYFMKELPLLEPLYQRKTGYQGHSAEDMNNLLGTAYVNIGEVYFKQLKIAQKKNLEAEAKTQDSLAMIYYRKSIDIFKGSLDVSYSLNNLGELYAEQHDYENAIRSHQEALQIARNLDSRNDVAISLLKLGQAYQKKNESSLALKSFLEAEKAADETESKYTLEGVYKGLSEIYSKMKDFPNAFRYEHALLSIREKIYTSENDKKLQGLDFKFTLKKKESEIGLLTKDKIIKEQEIRRQRLLRNGFIGGFAVVLLFAGVFFNQRNRISKEKKRSDELLLNILPEETAEELKATGTAKAKSFSSVTVMFTDFKNFTQASERMSPDELVKEIHYCYSEFDKIVTRHGIEKIKTIGDAYMCAGGLPVSNKTHPVDVVNAGIEMQRFMAAHKQERSGKGEPFFELRLGIHTGPVVAGVVGTKKFAYDIWGDTVNTASRMESSGETGKVNISGTTYELVRERFRCLHRGKVQAKNKGEIDMYFVDGSPVEG